MEQEVIYEAKDVDILVKVVDLVTHYFNNHSYTKIYFIDKHERLYLSEIKDMKIKLEKNMSVKLRSVTITAVKKTFSIEFFDYSEILLLSNGFKDSKELLSVGDRNLNTSSLS